MTNPGGSGYLERVCPMSDYDFMLERKLKEANNDLSYRYACCMSLFEQLLKRFLTTFPTFTDHSLLHSLSVTNIANQLLREHIHQLNASEIYIYLMASALHDIGMGIPVKDVDSYMNAAGVMAYANEHPGTSAPALIRKFHHDFSAAFVRKYWLLFEIPNECYANAIAEVCRGHRKTDLLDEILYPTDYDLGDGSTANLAALAAILRIADEMDIASDRNPDLLFDTESMEGMSEKDVFEFSRHDAIRSVDFTENGIYVHADTDDDEIAQGVIDCIRAIKETMSYCASVLNERSDLRIQCTKIELVLNGHAVQV